MVTSDEAKPLVNALVMISMGGDPTPTPHMTPEIIGELIDSYERAAPDIW
jgi:hypothetical protein